MESLLRISLLLLLAGCARSSGEAPNIVLIVTDDQDVVLNGLNPMIKTQQLVANRGATFVNAFTSSPICCPSRSSLLTGQYAHNVKVFNNSQSGGCYGTHWREKVEPKALPVLLQNAGYKTFYAGKYLNEYNSNVVPPGWGRWHGLHGNSKYYNYTLNENGQGISFIDDYLTDVLTNRTLDFILSIETRNSFFAMIAPPAPHAPYTAAKRHENLFPGVNALKTKNYNLPCGPLEKHWLLTMSPSPLPEDILGSIDIIYRKRWQSLMAVDEMVAAIVQHLETRKILDSTYFIYTSDNGYHMGQFGMPYDKRQPYETDIRVPFLMAGPKIPPKILVQSPVALIDIAPTVLELAGLKVPPNMDGTSIMEKLTHADIDERQILIEYWGEGTLDTHNPECPWQKKDKLALCTVDAACHCQDSWNNTYNCVRHLAKDLDLIYCRFKDNEHFSEAYDLSNDMYQIENIAYEMLPSIRAKYDLAITNLTQCTGETCRRRTGGTDPDRVPARNQQSTDFQWRVGPTNGERLSRIARKLPRARASCTETPLAGNWLQSHCWERETETPGILPSRRISHYVSIEWICRSDKADIQCRGRSADGLHTKVSRRFEVARRTGSVFTGVSRLCCVYWLNKLP